MYIYLENQKILSFYQYPNLHQFLLILFVVNNFTIDSIFCPCAYNSSRSNNKWLIPNQYWSSLKNNSEHFNFWFIFISQTVLTSFSRAISRANSYRLTGMGTQKNVLKKQKVQLLILTCLFVKRKFNKTHKDFSIN